MKFEKTTYKLHYKSLGNQAELAENHQIDNQHYVPETSEQIIQDQPMIDSNSFNSKNELENIFNSLINYLDESKIDSNFSKMTPKRL